MIKFFCDCCKDEITTKNEFTGKNTDFTIEGANFIIDFSEEKVKDDFNICKYCLFDAIAKLDDRPISNDIKKG